MPNLKPVPTEGKEEHRRKKTPSKKRWGDEEKEQARALHATGISNREIARQMGVSEARIRRLWQNSTPDESATLEQTRLLYQVQFVERAYQEIWRGLAALTGKREEASYKDIVWGCAVLADKIAAIPMPPPSVDSHELKQLIRSFVKHDQIAPAVIRPEYREHFREDRDPQDLAVWDWLIDVGLVQLEDPPDPPPPSTQKHWLEVQKEQLQSKEEAQEAKDRREFEAWKAERAKSAQAQPSEAVAG